MNKIKLSEFLNLDRPEIAKLVRKEKRPKCVLIMLDGTRRLLKIDPIYRDKRWSYYENPEKYLIYKSFDVANMLFDMGVEVVMGPLMSTGNLYRKSFYPGRMIQLLQSFLDSHPRSVVKKHSVKISFYGDLQRVYKLEDGDIISDYVSKITKLSAKSPKKHILVGLGYSTDEEVSIITGIAINHFKKHGKKPTKEQLVRKYFGFKVPPIDIFIRSNELRASGGLTPLLTDHGTQLYFPVSPGILSFSEEVVRKIIYDYLFERVISKGKHEHKSLTASQANELKEFYFNSKRKVVGVGRKIGDIWIND